MNDALSIRKAVPGDETLLLELIHALAAYEKLEHEVVATKSQVREALFGARSHAESVIAEWNGQPVGYALFFHNFSTFTGRPGLYLEDLFVLPDHRGAGIGRALLVHLARIAVTRDCGRFEWTVLDWNEPSIRFYESLGAKRHGEWLIYRLTGDALATLASETADREDGHGR